MDFSAVATDQETEEMARMLGPGVVTKRTAGELLVGDDIWDRSLSMKGRVTSVYVTEVDHPRLKDRIMYEVQWWHWSGRHLGRDVSTREQTVDRPVWVFN